MDAAIHCVQYEPAGDVITAGDDDGRIHFICAQTGEKILCPLRGNGRKVMSVSWSPDGTRLASGSVDKTVLIWDAASGEQLCSLNVDSAVLSVAYSPDGTKLTAGLGYPSYSVVVFDTQTNEQICSLRGE